jgi:putative ABC transport system permease protein
VIQRIDPDQPVQSLATMGDVIARTTSEPRFLLQVIGAFSMVAVLLSAIGLYGVLACSVAGRTREIGIRMALGAASGSVIRMVLRRTLRLAAAGVALGTVGAFALTRVLGAFLFEVRPTDPVAFTSVAVLLLAVALLAGLLPARRAATVDPLVALRHD